MMLNPLFAILTRTVQQQRYSSIFPLSRLDVIPNALVRRFGAHEIAT